MRLLMLAGAATQRRDPARLPAYERYDSPAWRVLRTILRTTPTLGLDLDVYALSATYGLLPAAHPMLPDRQHLDSLRAAMLQPLVMVRLEQVLAHTTSVWGGYTATLICGNQAIQQLVADPLPPGCGLVTRTGQLRPLARWLTATSE